MSSLNVHEVKNIRNALWSVPNLNPPDLIRADILHNMLLRVLDHMMDWIQEFLEQHDRMNAFDHVWSRLPPYPGFTVPAKAYRIVTQWSGKEMRNFAKVIIRKKKVCFGCFRYFRCFMKISFAIVCFRLLPVSFQ